MPPAQAIVKATRPVRILGSALAAAGRVLLDGLYPPVCLACEAPVQSSGALCHDCWRGLRPITRPFCPRLGLPFEVDLGSGTLSAEAIARPPPFDRARSAVLYNEVARSLVGRLKYGDRPEIAVFCARLMALAASDILTGRPVLVPVPLHPVRQWQRRFNQSAELARALARQTGSSVDFGLVKRSRRTPQQVGQSASGRARNVAGAFAPSPDALNRLRGRRVVIVDDVITTGATVEAVTRALRRGGAAAIDVISFGRVVLAADSPI